MCDQPETVASLNMILLTYTQFFSGWCNYIWILIFIFFVFLHNTHKYTGNILCQLCSYEGDLDEIVKISLI